MKLNIIIKAIILFVTTSIIAITSPVVAMAAETTAIDTPAVIHSVDVETVCCIADAAGYNVEAIENGFLFTKAEEGRTTRVCLSEESCTKSVADDNSKIGGAIILVPVFYHAKDRMVTVDSENTIPGLFDGEPVGEGSPIPADYVGYAFWFLRDETLDDSMNSVVKTEYYHGGYVYSHK